jgi:signal peptidase I
MPDPVMQNVPSPETSENISRSGTRSLLGYTLVALVIALVIRFFIAAPYVVSGASMEPVFDNWHYLIVDRISYRFTDPERGDVIVFSMPGDRGRALIKRVIGLPGETVVLEGDGPRVTIINKEYPDGFTIDEPYLDPTNLGGATDMRINLGTDQYFVLGDNRRVSSDSRVWGVLPRKNIVGRVLLRLYPIDKLGVMPGDVSYQ